MAEYYDIPLFGYPKQETPEWVLHERIGYLETILCALAPLTLEAASQATHYVNRYQDYILPSSLERFRRALELRD